MDNDTAVTIIEIVTWALGAGYVVYGKNQKKWVAAVCGVGLCFYSYFFDDVWELAAIGAVLTIVPAFFRI